MCIIIEGVSGSSPVNCRNVFSEAVHGIMTEKLS